LSARSTNTPYLIDTVTTSVQMMSDKTPSALSAVNWPPVACTTV